MSSGDTLAILVAQAAVPPNWAFVAFTSGSVEPSPGDVIWGDASNENGILEVLVLTSGTWGGNDAAGYMLLSNLTGVVGDWTSGEDFTEGSTTPANHGTLTALPVSAFATFDMINDTPVLDFDDTANEVAQWPFMLPQHYGGSGIDVIVVQAAAAATGDLAYNGYFRSFTDDVDNLLATAFNAWSAAQANQAIDAPSVVGELTYDTIAFTDGAQIDSLAAGEKGIFMLERDAQDATNDDLSGDASVVLVELRET